MEKQIEKKELVKLYLWTLSYFSPFIGITFIYVICGGVIIWGELMIPRRMGYIIDYIIPLKNVDSLSRQIIFLGGIAILIIVTKSVFTYLEFNISNKIIKNQQTDLIKKLQQLGFSYYEQVPTGKILSMFENSVREVQKTYTFLFPQFIYSLAQFIVPSIILVLGQPLFFVASMIGNIFYVFLNRSANNKIHFYLGKETKAAHRSQQSLYDSIVAVPELKAMGSSEWYIKKAVQEFNQYRLPRMNSIFWRHFRYTTVGLTLTISTVMFYLFGLDFIKNGELLLGEFIGYSFLMGLVSRGFSVFFYIIPAQYHALNYAKDLYDFMHLKPDVEESLNSIKDNIENFNIEFKNVSFSYYKDLPIINNISFKIAEGKKTAIVGESGSGKSTILKLIGRFYDVTEGEIKIGDHDIKHLKLNNLRKDFGYVFQDTYLFNMSIKDNIKFGNPCASDKEVIEAAKMANAHEFIMETNKGYETIAGERGLRFSGGQKQRIAIARMLLKRPKIVLLDEATSALDSVSEDFFKKSLVDLSKGKTIVTVAHRLSTIVEYDSIIVLESGKIVEQGTYQELLDIKGSFYKLVMRGVIDEN